MDSYKKMVKNLLIKEHAWDRKFGDPLPTLEDVMNEAESMQLQPKGGGKTVKFTDKDNYEKAKKSGDYEEPEETDDDGGEDKPAANVGADDAQLGGDRSADAGDEPSDKTKDDEEPSDDEKPSDAGKADVAATAINNNLYTLTDDDIGGPADADDIADAWDDLEQDLLRKGKGDEWSEIEDTEVPTGQEGYGADENMTLGDIANAIKHYNEDGMFEPGEDREYALRGFEDEEAAINAFKKGIETLTSKSARTGKELGKNETLKINGKMYRKVQEQKETSKKHPLREAYERIGGK